VLLDECGGEIDTLILRDSPNRLPASPGWLVATGAEAAVEL
jgi:hypothetical protein